MTIKSMHIYVIAAVASLSMGLSATEYNAYKTFAYKILKNILVPSFSIETRAIDAINTAPNLKNVPNIDLFSSIKPETRMIGEKNDQKMVIVGRPHNDF